MDRLRHHARVFFTALFISQVCGFPTFYWSQPDCLQQPSDDSYNGYGSFQGYNYQPPNSYQGPSYQDTLRGMVDDTVSAVNDIVRVTVTAVKQELVELSKILYDNFQSKNCDSPVDNGDSSDYNEMNQIFDSPVQIISFPGQSLGTQYTSHVAPQNKIPSNVETLPSLVPRNKTYNSEGSDLEDKIGNDQTNVSEKPSTSIPSNNTNIMYVHFPSSSPENTTKVPSSPSSVTSANPVQVNSTDIDFNSSHSASIHGGNNITLVNPSTEHMSGSMNEQITKPVGIINETDITTNATSLASTTNKLTTVNTSSVPPTTGATSAITFEHQTTLIVSHNATSETTTEESSEHTDEFTTGVDQVTSTDFTTDGSATDTTETSTFPIDFDIVTTMATNINSSSFTTGPSTEIKTESIFSMTNATQTLAANVSASPGTFETSTMVNNITSTTPAATNTTASGSTTEGVKETTNTSGIRPNEEQQFTPRLDSLSTEATTKATRNPKL